MFRKDGRNINTLYMVETKEESTLWIVGGKTEPKKTKIFPSAGIVANYESLLDLIENRVARNTLTNVPHDNAPVNSYTICSRN